MEELAVLVEPSEAQHMSQMHYFAFSRGCWGLEQEIVACPYIRRAAEKANSRKVGFRFEVFSEIAIHGPGSLCVRTGAMGHSAIPRE